MFEHVGGHWSGSDNLCPTFGSAEALRVYTVKMQRDVVSGALAAAKAAAPGALPAGWRSVPERATPEMLLAAGYRATSEGLSDTVIARGRGYSPLHRAPRPAQEDGNEHCNEHRSSDNAQRQ